MIVPDNLDLMGMSRMRDDLRPEKRDLGISHKLSLILGAYMISTQPEFNGGNDPRPAVIPEESVNYLRRMLENANVDVDGSIDRALNRTGATA